MTLSCSFSLGPRCDPALTSRSSFPSPLCASSSLPHFPLFLLPRSLLARPGLPWGICTGSSPSREPSPDLQGDSFESFFVQISFLSLPASLQPVLFSGILILLTLFFSVFFSLLSPSSLKYYLIYLFVIFITYSVYPQTDFNVSSRRKRILEFCSLMNWKGLALGWSHSRWSINICGMNADRTEFKGSKKVEKMQS